jgi:D-alanyl-lipoteichoic acid acyltransferase DltB (MBOAT superfamily)
MLFNSYEFLFFFFPVTIALFFALSGFKHIKLAAAWLALVSIFFYGYWSPRYVILLMTSIALNFVAGRLILKYRNAAQSALAYRTLVFALVANLGALAYFKYANFFVNNLNSVAHLDITLAQIILPIGISFFTFTQIAYLVDTYQGKVQESRFVPYILFVTFFPHLIAGPVLHHSEMMPQFAKADTYRFKMGNFLIGVAFFAIGLFKKVVLADGIQPFVGPVFEADPTSTLTMVAAWGGVLAYTLQLYFDFSGYSDMAIGLSKMLNVDLPLNFNSPYKATNISEFWRRWHMTLSRFLRDYLYVPLGGNRKGPSRRYLNLMATMLLGGLWHGAGWTFVIWGGLHGLFLVIHQQWQQFRGNVLGQDLSKSNVFGQLLSIFITFICVVIAWVFFRATNVDAAWSVLMGMFGFNGVVLPLELKPFLEPWLSTGGTHLPFGELEAFGGLRQLGWITVLLAIVWLCPNSQTMVQGMQSSRWGARFREERWAWMCLGGLAVWVVMLAAINGSHGSSEFIYFNF